MNTNNNRLTVIGLIWVAFAVATAVTFWGRASLQIESVFIALFYVMGAVEASKYVARMSDDEETGKAKSGKVSRLLESLNDEELDILRKRLSAEAPDEPADGEVLSLEDVLRKERPV